MPSSPPKKTPANDPIPLNIFIVASLIISYNSISSWSLIPALAI